MHHLPLTLNLAVDPHHRRRHQHPALAFVERWPNDGIDDPGLVFKREEHYTLCRTGPLADEDQPCGPKPATIALSHGLRTGYDPLLGDILAQEAHRVLTKRQAGMGIVFDASLPSVIDFRTTSGSINSEAVLASRSSAATQSSNGSSRSGLILKSARRRSSRSDAGRRVPQREIQVLRSVLLIAATCRRPR